MFCSSCGQNIQPCWKFCVSCGSGILSAETTVSTSVVTTGTSTSTSSAAASAAAVTAIPSLSPGGAKSLQNLLVKYMDKPLKAKKCKDETVIITVHFVCKGKIVRNIFASKEGSTGKLKLSSSRDSCVADWGRMISANFHDVKTSDVTFLSMSEDGYVPATPDQLKMSELLKKKNSYHSTEIRLFVTIKNKSRDALKKAYKLKKTSSPTVTEQLEVNASCSTAEVTPEKQLKESVEEDELDDDLPIIPFLKRRRTSETATATVTVDNKQDEDIITLDDEDIEKIVSSESPQLQESLPETNCAGIQGDNINLDEVEDRQDREMERFLMLQSKKHDRQKMATGRLLHKDPGTLQKNICYQAHGGISLSFKIKPSDDMEVLFDLICKYIDPEILPPMFSLCDVEDNKNIYTRLSSETMNQIPEVLIVTEEEYNLDETLTNYDEVYFK